MICNGLAMQDIRSDNLECYGIISMFMKDCPVRLRSDGKVAYRALLYRVSLLFFHGLMFAKLRAILGRSGVMMAIWGLKFQYIGNNNHIFNINTFCEKR